MKKHLLIILCITVSLTVCAGCEKTPEQSPSPESTQTNLAPQPPTATPPSAPATTSATAPATTPATTPATAPTATSVTAPTTAPVASSSDIEGFSFTEENFPRIDGSTATIPLIGAVTSALLGKPRSEINVSVSKTSEAYVALAHNNADILLVYDGGDETRVMVNADEVFETAPIGKDALVFLVNRDNPVENLTTEQVRKIFSGEYANWRELGGRDEPIRAYQRGVGSGSQALMDKLVMNGLPMADPLLVPVVGDMGGLVDAVADFSGGPSGIGYNVYFYVTEMRGNDYIKILSINGVTPDYDSIQSGEYPFVSDFYSVIRKDEPAGSPARALHEWMLTDEAQNLIAGERYVALHANPSADTPDVDGKFTIYPEGEAPEYFEGVEPFTFEPGSDYGQLYFYLGVQRWDEWASAQFYGLCTADGKIVTEPVYTVPLLMTDSTGARAYFCYRSDRDAVVETVELENWSYEQRLYPALLFATDGSWIKEFDAAMPFYGNMGPSNIIMNADVLAVMRDGKWGAVNLKGETVIPFNRESYMGIYARPDGGIGGFAVTGDRFMLNTGEDESGNWLFDLYDGNSSLIASGLRGRPQGVAGEYIVTVAEWRGEAKITIYTYTLDGNLIATRASPVEGVGTDAYSFGDYVMIYAAHISIICDRELNVLHEFQHEGSYAYYARGPNVLYSSDRDKLFHRTYLPDGTLLVSWYDPGMA